MNRFISIHPDKCIGCGTCRAACSEGHRAIGKQSEPRISVIQTKDVSAAVTCHHCEDAPCLQICPVAAITRDDGAIKVNEQTCIGCKLCSMACPFGAIHPAGTSIAGVAGMMVPTPTFSKTLDPALRWEIGVYTCAVKCDLCDDIEGGPRCVAGCPTNALEYVDERTPNKQAYDKRVAAVEASGQIQNQLSEVRRMQ